MAAMMCVSGSITDSRISPTSTEHIHCSTLVTRYEAEQVLAGEWTIWPQFYQKQIEELRQFVTGYDYDGLFERYGWADGAPPEDPAR